MPGDMHSNARRTLQGGVRPYAPVRLIRVKRSQKENNEDDMKKPRKKGNGNVLVAVSDDERSMQATYDGDSISCTIGRAPLPVRVSNLDVKVPSVLDIDDHTDVEVGKSPAGSKEHLSDKDHRLRENVDDIDLVDDNLDIEWLYAIVMPVSAGSERFDLLCRLIHEEFGVMPPSRDGRKRLSFQAWAQGKFHRRHSFIKVTLSLQRMEAIAERSKLPVRLRDEFVSRYGRRYVPFHRSLKQQYRLDHNTAAGREHCAAAVIDALAAPFSSGKDAPSCNCNLFTPYQRQHIVDLLLVRVFHRFDVIDMQRTNAVRSRSCSSGQGEERHQSMKTFDDAGLSTVRLPPPLPDVDDMFRIVIDGGVCIKNESVNDSDDNVMEHPPSKPKKRLLLKSHTDAVAGHLSAPRAKKQNGRYRGKPTTVAAFEKPVSINKEKQRVVPSEQSVIRVCKWGGGLLDMYKGVEPTDDALFDRIALNRLKSRGLLTAYFPLHSLKSRRKQYSEYEDRHSFSRRYCSWTNMFCTPWTCTRRSRDFVQYMRDYFGEKIAIYFAFLTHFNTYLLYLSLPGVALAAVQFALGFDNGFVPLYAFLTALWSVLFVETWGMRQDLFSVKWGMSSFFEEVDRELLSFTSSKYTHLRAGLHPSGGSAAWIDLHTYKDNKREEIAHDVAVETSALLKRSQTEEVGGNSGLDKEAYEKVRAVWLEKALVFDEFVPENYRKEEVPTWFSRIVTIACICWKYVSCCCCFTQFCCHRSRSHRVSEPGEVLRKKCESGHQRHPRRRPASSSLLRGFDVFQLCVSVSVITTFSCAVIAATLAVLAFKVVAQDVHERWGGYAGGVANAISIAILDYVFRIVAEALCSWELHRTASAFENALIRKMFIFQVLNAYSSLFYIAFAKNSPETFGIEDKCRDLQGDQTDNCMAELSTQLTAIMITRIFLGNVVEIGTPWAVRLWNRMWSKRKLGDLVITDADRLRMRQRYPNRSDEFIEHALQKWVPAIEKQFNMSAYGDDKISGTFDELNELLIVFGYVVLFAPAFPLAPVIAILANVFENAMDCYKLMFTVRKPPYHGAKSIGTWYFLFRALAAIGVVTNLCIIAFTSRQLEEIIGTDSSFYKLLFVIIAEHVILGLQMLLSDAAKRLSTGMMAEREKKALVIDDLEADYHRHMQHLALRSIAAVEEKRLS